MIHTDNGIIVNFLLKKLWVKENQIARVELVLTFRRELLSSQYNYTVAIDCGDFDDDDSDESRFSVVENLKAHAGFFTRSFVIVPITKIVKTIILNNRDDNDDGKRWQALTVRVRVDEIHENGDVHQLRANVVRRLFHMHNDERSRPILVLFSSEIDSSSLHVDHRRKRRLRRTSSRSSLHPVSNLETNCGLRQWKVNLTGLLATRIIHPHEPFINYCSGTCPFPAFDSHWNATSNAVIRNAFVATGRNGASGNQMAVVPDAVCVPHSLRSLSILYFEDNFYIMKTLDHVVATSCMCA